MGITYVSWIAPDSGPAPFACVTALDPSSAASMFSDLDGTPAAVNDPVRRMLDAKYGGHAYYNPDTGLKSIWRRTVLGDPCLRYGAADDFTVYMRSENAEIPFDTCNSSAIIICVALALVPESAVNAFFRYVTSGVTYRLDVHRAQLVATLSGGISATGGFSPDPVDDGDGPYVPDIPEIANTQGVLTAIFDGSKATVAAGQLRIRINGAEQTLSDVTSYTGAPFTVDKGQVQFNGFLYAPIYALLVGSDISELAAYEQWCADRIGMDL